ncbi:hypothetical protein GGR56DRAFT_444146 [Xylariaceae sp. FL0804]|nr:hypothetical protein GGR56DRAFT_444146 [Xylariaceae sp. FL0804]
MVERLGLESQSGGCQAKRTPSRSRPSRRCLRVHGQLRSDLYGVPSVPTNTSYEAEYEATYAVSRVTAAPAPTSEIYQPSLIPIMPVATAGVSTKAPDIVNQAWGLQFRFPLFHFSQPRMRFSILWPDRFHTYKRDEICDRKKKPGSSGAPELTSTWQGSGRKLASGQSRLELLVLRGRDARESNSQLLGLCLSPGEPGNLPDSTLELQQRLQRINSLPPLIPSYHEYSVCASIGRSGDSTAVARLENLLSTLQRSNPAQEIWVRRDAESICF